VIAHEATLGGKTFAIRLDVDPDTNEPQVVPVDPEEAKKAYDADTHETYQPDKADISSLLSDLFSSGPNWR